MSQTALVPVVNRNLFSNHYLENFVQKNPEWKLDAHVEVFEKILRIYNAIKPFLNQDMPESSLEDKFLRPVFKLLLPEYDVQAAAKSGDFPDYAFFPDQNALDDSRSNRGKASFYVNAIAVGEAKRWDVELDKFGKDKHNKRTNPSFQIWLYLHETEPRWGILSNGRKWRLYHQDKPLDCYYEVDLASLLENGDVDGFRYFYYFFRKEAFLPNEKGEVFLERVLRESADYAKEIGDNLKENVYRAMKIISDGFLHWKQNNLDYTDEIVRAEVQKSTMRLLYRLLFLLYAEGKSLLDLRDELYRNSYSFYRLKKEVSDKLEGSKQEQYLPASTTLWSRLKDLFRLIDQGSEAFGIPREEFYVPAYNGGLFEADKNPNLERWTIGDTYLAEAIDLLARSKTKDEKAFVDYSTLEIRHLGSIYEGLLEYKLKIAGENLVVTGTKKREWVTLEEYNKSKKVPKIFEDFETFDRVNMGGIYLATDKGERKATGSYYTPDYIVNYIVENTIGPVLEEKWKAANENNDSLVEATLSTKVLDPAMGSGHFLVGALEYMAARLLEAVKLDIETGKIEESEQYTPDWAKREIVSHCIYGVDLNEMAVELGKLSLWLTTISKDKPLSFLDHRLKCGNSLIGASLAELPWHPSVKRDDKQQRLDIPEGFIKKLVDTVGKISAIDDSTLEHVRQKERLFAEFKNTREYDMIKTLADVRTSTYFGNTIDPQAYGNYAGDAFWSTETEWKQRREKSFAKQAREITTEKHFFHWELEYPEIFFDQGKTKENPGFDAVIGNPPYVRVHKLDEEIKEYLWIIFYSYKAKSDILNCFIERGTVLLREEGGFGYITSDTWRILSSSSSLRGLLLDTCEIGKVVMLPDGVFEDASVKPMIIILRKQLDNLKRLDNIMRIYDFDFEKEIGDYMQRNYTTPPDFLFHVVPKSHIKLRDKIREKSEKLECYLNIDFGLKTGDDKRFIKQMSGSGDDKKVVASESIERYSLSWKGDFVWYVPEKMKEHRSTARPGTAERFERNKIVISRMASRISATYDNENYYIKDAFVCHTISNLSDIYILSLLNSKTIFYYYSEVFTTIDFHRNELLQLPLRRISFTTPTDHRTALVEEAKKLYTTEPNESKELLDFVAERLSAKPEESDVVHDLLAYLAQQMLDTNKQKNQEIQGFLQWLETELQAKIDDLTNKTQLKEYHKQTFEELIAILKKNSKKIPVNTSDRTFQENLRREYDKSTSTLTPLLDKIQKTDWLIDQIVYKLYDLTPEEIKIVEEAVGA